MDTWSGDHADPRGSSGKRAPLKTPANFNATLRDDDQRESLGKSLASEFSLENLDFMTACFNFQTLHRDGLLEHSAQKHKYLAEIMKQFVGGQAAGQLNLSDVTELGLLSEWRDLEAPITNGAERNYALLFVLIDRAVDEIENVVSRDSFKRHVLQLPQPPQARKPSFADRISAGAARFSDKAKQKINPNNPPKTESDERWVPRFATQQMKEWADPILARKYENRGPGPDEELKGAPPNRDIRNEIRALLEELHLDTPMQPQAHALSSAMSAPALNPRPEAAGSSASSSSVGADIGGAGTAAAISPREISGTFDSLLFHCEKFLAACKGEPHGIQRKWARAIERDFLAPQQGFSCANLTNDRVLEALTEWLDDKAKDESEIVRIVRSIGEAAVPMDQDA